MWTKLYPNSKYSVSLFNDIQGNIRFKTTQHVWQNGKCAWCGASEKEYRRGDDLETHAYEFIHTNKLEEIFGMKFDVIIGNPPYQLSDGGFGKSAKPIYQHFVEQAKKLKPKYMTMIIPARWYTGGKGLDSFRNTMLHDKSIRKIVDYPNASEVFNGVDIAGGVCYFLWDRDHKGDCIIVNKNKDKTETESTRPLNEFPTFIRNNHAVDIVKKVRTFDDKTMDDMVLSRCPFGLDSKTKFDTAGTIILRSSSGLGKINKHHITAGTDILDKWKVIVSKVSFDHACVPDKNGTMRVLSIVQKLPPNSACTDSYLVVGSFNKEEEADSLISYLRTKFVRFLLIQMLASTSMSKFSYSYVPIVPFDHIWTDEELYTRYKFSEVEIACIKAMIRPMPEINGK